MHGLSGVATSGDGGANRCRAKSSVWLSYEHLDRSNFLIAQLRAPLSQSVLYHEKGSSIGAFNSVSIASCEVVLGLNFFCASTGRSSPDVVSLDDMIVSAWSSKDSGEPLTDAELAQRIRDADSIYASNPPSDPHSVARLCIDVWAKGSGDVADAVANRVFNSLCTSVGGSLTVAPNFQFSDLYPNGINGKASVMLDDGRRIAELVFANPTTETQLRDCLKIQHDLRLLGGDGTQLDGALFHADCDSVHFVARQF